jgi:phosphoglycolate phosphatase
LRSTKSNLRRDRAQATSARNPDRLAATRRRVKIVLFDIDGTLIRTGGAGVRAMNRAFEDIFGSARALDGIPMAGRTDMSILMDASSRAGVEITDERLRLFRERYAQRLSEALPEVGHRQEVLPGVRKLLETLRQPPWTRRLLLALLTGNSAQGAQLKLEYFDLWRFFLCGAFGDDVHHRRELFPVALQRASSAGAGQVAPAEVLVVGDTEHDVECASAAGARSLAVATGLTDSATLRRCGADTVFEDLSDTEAFLQLL